MPRKKGTQTIKSKAHLKMAFFFCLTILDAKSLKFSKTDSGDSMAAARIQMSNFEWMLISLKGQ